MPIPATSGQLKTNILDMQIGDYIPCKYVASSGAIGVFSELGTSTGTEIPVASTATPTGLFYFIKVDKGLLIADRVVQHSISWDMLNITGRMIEGVPLLGGLIRSISGGVAYLGADGLPKATNQGLGAFPSNNEWDKYIRNSNLDGKIIAGDDNVWNARHINGNKPTTWCIEKPLPIIATADNKVRRTLVYTDISQQQIASNGVNTFTGFRPVLEYRELDNPSQNLF